MNSNKIENRIIKKTPATTSVDEWIKADAGVGASMASGSQTWEKNWAALIPPDNIKDMEKKVKKWYAVAPTKRKWNVRNGIWTKIQDKSVELNTTIVNKNDININMSLIRENTNVFWAALIV